MKSEIYAGSHLWGWTTVASGGGWWGICLGAYSRDWLWLCLWLCTCICILWFRPLWITCLSLKTPSLFDFPPHHPHRSLDYWRYACLPHGIYTAPSKPTGQGQLSNISLWSTHTVDLKCHIKTKSMHCMSEETNVWHFNVTYKIENIKLFKTKVLTWSQAVSALVNYFFFVHAAH